MKSYLQFIFLLLFNFSSCKSESEKTLERFKKINESLKNFNIDTTFVSIYDRISQERVDNPSLYLIADTLKSKLYIANTFLDSLISAIEEFDPTGEKMDFVTTKLIDKSKGDELVEKTRLIYRYTVAETSDQNLKNNIVSLFKKYRGLLGTTEFLHLIDKTPSLGVVTVLRGVKNDCVKAAIICAQDIELRLH